MNSAAVSTNTAMPSGRGGAEQPMCYGFPAPAPAPAASAAPAREARAAALTSSGAAAPQHPSDPTGKGGTQTGTKMRQHCPQVTLGTATFHISKE